MNQGRVLHPRPAVPAITSTHSCSEVNMLQHIISPGMHSDKPSPGKGEKAGCPKNGNKKTLFNSLVKSSPSNKSPVESHERYTPTNPDDMILDTETLAIENGYPKRASINGRPSASVVTESSGEPCQ